MRILITNDDGIEAQGIKQLRASLGAWLDGLPGAREHSIITVAPDRERSANGHSVTFHEPLHITGLKEGERGQEMAITGTPTDCVMMGILGPEAVRPDLLVSGINSGANMGFDITYSGTASAALEGMIAGVPSLAVSLGGRHPEHFESAGAYAVKVAAFMMEHRGDFNFSRVYFNLNVPDLPLEQIKGIRLTRQSSTVYRQFVERREDPWGRAYFWLAGELPQGSDEGTSALPCDFRALEQGWASLTPLQVDMTAYALIERLRSCGLE